MVIKNLLVLRHYISVIFLFLSHVAILQNDAYTQNASDGLLFCKLQQETISAFSSNKHAVAALNKITEVSGISNRFILYRCSDIDNCTAVTLRGVRYIYYDPVFMEEINSNNSITNLSILAHEVGHHVNGHPLEYFAYMSGDIPPKPLEQRRKEELEADEFSGFVMHKLGYTLEQAQKAINELSFEGDDTYSTHPNKLKRLNATAKGYNNSKNNEMSENYDYRIVQATNLIDTVSYLIGQTVADNVLRQMSEGKMSMLIRGLSDRIYKTDPLFTDPDNSKLNAYFNNRNSENIYEVSYLLGQIIAKSVLRQMSEVNKEMIIQGLSDKLYDRTALCSDPGNVILNVYFQEKNRILAEKAEKENLKYKTEGEQFMSNNKLNKDVVVTASGLQYIILNKGNGPKPTATSKVKVHYHGTTPYDVVFDSSVDRGEPITFGLNQVIKGWTEGVQLMPVGSKFKFFIPQELAYGANPQPGSVIKPYMPLVFEVELLEIVSE